MLPPVWMKMTESNPRAVVRKNPSFKPARTEPELASNDSNIPNDDSEQPHPSDGVTETAQPARNTQPTHPRSPDVLSEFPPFEYTTPPRLKRRCHGPQCSGGNRPLRRVNRHCECWLLGQLLRRLGMAMIHFIKTLC
ncbi:hypothetical protein M3J09_010324 [Ascochyta lentis]